MRNISMLKDRIMHAIRFIDQSMGPHILGLTDSLSPRLTKLSFLNDYNSITNIARQHSFEANMDFFKIIS